VKKREQWDNKQGRHIAATDKYAKNMQIQAVRRQQNIDGFIIAG
jgi:hypothetical protein